MNVWESYNFGDNNVTAYSLLLRPENANVVKSLYHNAFIHLNDN